MVTANPATAPTSASQRAAAASRSRCSASTRTPATIGTQMARLIKGSTVSRASAHHPPGEQRQHRQDHGEGVVVDAARLNMAQERRCSRNHPGASVDEESVDHRAVADVGSDGADLAKAAGKKPVVELIDEVV